MPKFAFSVDFDVTANNEIAARDIVSNLDGVENIEIVDVTELPPEEVEEEEEA